MDAQLKAKWIDKIKTTPLWRKGGYTEFCSDIKGRTLRIIDDNNYPCCVMAKFFAVHPDATAEYDSFSKIIMEFDNEKFQELVKMNDNGASIDEIIAYIERNF